MGNLQIDRVTIVGSISAILGFIGKSLWDLYWGKRKALQKLALSRRVDFLENQLSRFYWPIYIRLQKDNVVWERILDRSRGTDDLRGRVGHAIEDKFLLPNHDEIVRIIQDNIHLARPDQALESQLLLYVRHIAVYRAIRDCGVTDTDPIALNEPWPTGLFPLIAEHTHVLQDEYDGLIGRVTRAI